MTAPLGYCEHCGWPVAPEGVTLTGRDALPPEHARPERCDDTACAVTAPRADAWNAYRWLDDEGTRCVCVASEPTLDAAMEAARRLGAHQVQRGLDGRVEVVS